MPTKIISTALLGLDAVPVEVEADTAQGLPNFVIVGLPDTAVQEARERVRTALRNSGLPFPRTRITVNLAPADLRKEGPSYDLPIAIAILESTGALPEGVGKKRIFLGELALDGALRPVNGTLAAALLAARRQNQELYVPEANAAEAALAAGVRIFPVRSVSELIRHLRGETEIDVQPATDWQPDELHPIGGIDFADIRGQAHAKRALEIAAAGGHNLLFSGPPGSGKTMLARALPGILPPLSREEAIDITRIRSAAGLIRHAAMSADVTAAGTERPGSLVSARPFRSPHHTASGIALIGGGSWPRPGEVSLAHHGVLFLDELPEFSRAALENLRQPLEDGSVSVSRAGGSVTYPSKFMLISAQNPCPCGYASDPNMACSCPPSKIAAYGRRVSGPLLERIDLRVEVPRLQTTELLESSVSESSAVVRARVLAARKRQQARLAPFGLRTNSEIGNARLRKVARLDVASEQLLRSAIDRLGLSARAVTRVLRVALTIVDLDGSEEISSSHIAEAIQYRERNAA